MADPLVIGVDAGGTKTAAWLCHRNAKDGSPPVAVGHAGPGNMRSVGFEAAVREIDRAIAGAFSAAGLLRQPVFGVCLCAAGAGRPREQNQLLEWAHSQRLGQNIRTCTDVEAVLAAENPGRVGVALVCGTGSLAWGRDAAGMEARSGGWGFLIGDEGSAYAIAVAGLRSATHAVDRRGPVTKILERLMHLLRVTEPVDLVERLYTGPMTRSEIAGLAQCVFQAAEQSDLVAEEILDEAAKDLALMIDTVVARLNFPSAVPVALAGGVILNQHDFRRSVLARTAQPVGRVHLVPEPVAGAVELARLN